MKKSKPSPAGPSVTTGNVFYHRIPSYEPWCRDHGSHFTVNRGRELAIVDWDYNAWGSKYSTV